MNPRHYRRILLATLLLALAAPFGHSAEKPVRTNSELIEEQAEELSAADKRMNAAYQKLLGLLGDEGKAALRSAQRKWLAWRDAQAEFDAHQLKGGKLWQMELHGSTAATTARRATQLQEDYKRFK